MSLETTIQDLEHKLALKKAFLAVKVNIPGKFSKEVKKEVSEVLRALCEKLADEQEINNTNNQVLTEEEIVVLKTLANKVLGKNTTTEAKTENIQKTPTQQPQEKLIKENNNDDDTGMQQATTTLQHIIAAQVQMPNMMGSLMTLENVDKAIRGNVEPLAKVSILKVNEETNLAWVQDKSGNRFNVPLDDIEVE